MIRRILLALLLARPLTAQSDTVSKTLFTGRDGRIALGFLLTSAAISHFDPKITHWFTDTALSHVRTGQRLDKYFTHINETTLTLAGVAAYGVGRLSHSQSMTDIAFHTTESIVTASLASQLIRGPLGRSRPTTSASQYDFHWFKGFTNFKYRAFPSIHSASGFAAATALVEETRIRHPHAVKFVAPLALRFGADAGPVADVPRPTLGERRFRRRVHGHVRGDEGRAVLAHAPGQSVSGCVCAVERAVDERAGRAAWIRVGERF